MPVKIRDATLNFLITKIMCVKVSSSLIIVYNGLFPIQRMNLDYHKNSIENKVQSEMETFVNVNKINVKNAFSLENFTYNKYV